MALDSLTISALAAELRRELMGYRVDRVQQPERDHVLLALRGPGGAKRLLLCADPAGTRAHLTDQSFENPAAPPMFCMLLRKHLVGSRVTEVTQPGLERLLDFNLDASDEMGYAAQNHLICELFGKSANLILTDGEGIILDCLRRVGELGAKRAVLPGLRYQPPTPQDKPDPRRETETGFLEKLSHASARTAEKFLTDTYIGLSPLLCRELVFRVSGDGETSPGELRDRGLGAALFRELSELLGQAERGELTPILVRNEAGEPTEISCTPMTRLGRWEQASSFSELLDLYWQERDRRESLRRRSASLRHTVKTALDRTNRRLALQREELAQAGNKDLYRRRGDLITANIWRLRKGMAEFETEDFYGDGTVTVPLDPRKTPQQNAAACFKEYTRARTAERILTERIAAGEAEARYLESVALEIDRAEGERDLAEIRAELISAGFLKAPKGKPEKRPRRGPLRFLTPDGTEILVGRSNLENDELTFRLADRKDLWLHVQKIHGSHVILRCGGAEPSEETLTMAASLAVWYSQAREGGRAPVDVTAVRYVKKPAGARPGMVIYTNEKTLAAAGDEALVRRLALR